VLRIRVSLFCCEVIATTLRYRMAHSKIKVKTRVEIVFSRFKLMYLNVRFNNFIPELF
jgi:hypothetical protein